MGVMAVEVDHTDIADHLVVHSSKIYCKGCSRYNILTLKTSTLIKPGTSMFIICEGYKEHAGRAGKIISKFR